MPEILEQKTLPLPSVPANGYLIRVAAVSINPADYKNVDPSGPTFAIRMPGIPCSDFSGVVVGGPKDGLEVYGHIPTEQTILWHVSHHTTTEVVVYVVQYRQPQLILRRVRALSRNTSSLHRRSYYQSRRI
jgi:hypothetical protein